MILSRRLLPLIGLLAAVGMARPAAAGMLRMYAHGDGGASLVRFNAGDPSSIERVAFFDGDDQFLDSIDFRPATGELFGYRSATATYYTVNLETGFLITASVDPVGATTNTFFLGMDWNPTIDRLRVVTESTQNIVFNPVAGTATEATPLFYGAGDPNEEFAPVVIENAYTQNRAGSTSTQQYVLDHDLNLLATLANNAGTLSTVGNITLNGSVLDFDEYAGFDIRTSADGVDVAYALLTVGGMPGFYTIDLTSGEATFRGSLSSDFGPIYGLSGTVVPEPSSLALVGTGVLSLAVVTMRRRRRRAA